MGRERWEETVMKWDEKRYLEIVMETDGERDVERV